MKQTIKICLSSMLTVDPRPQLVLHPCSSLVFGMLRGSKGYATDGIATAARIQSESQVSSSLSCNNTSFIDSAGDTP